jgi:hypothetical protein
MAHRALIELLIDVHPLILLKIWETFLTRIAAGNDLGNLDAAVMRSLFSGQLALLTLFIKVCARMIVRQMQSGELLPGMISVGLFVFEKALEGMTPTTTDPKNLWFFKFWHPHNYWENV